MRRARRRSRSRRCARPCRRWPGRRARASPGGGWRARAGDPPTRRRTRRGRTPRAAPSRRRRRRRRSPARRAPHQAGQNRRVRSSSVDALRHGSTGATPIRNSSISPIGCDSRSKYGAPTSVWRSCERLDEQREQRAEQHDERPHREQHVVGEERPLTRQRRVDRAGRSQPVAAPRDQPERHDDDDAEEREQPRARPGRRRTRAPS